MIASATRNATAAAAVVTTSGSGRCQRGRDRMAARYSRSRRSHSRLLGCPAGNVERVPRAREKRSGRWAPQKLTALVLLAAALAIAALVGLASIVGFGKVLSALIRPHWLWLGVAVAGEVVAYLGYSGAYREIARSDEGA